MVCLDHKKSCVCVHKSRRIVVNFKLSTELKHVNLDWNVEIKPLHVELNRHITHAWVQGFNLHKIITENKIVTEMEPILVLVIHMIF